MRYLSTRPGRRRRAPGEYCTLMTASVPRWMLDEVERVAEAAGVSRSRVVVTALGMIVGRGMGEEEVGEAVKQLRESS